MSLTGRARDDEDDDVTPPRCPDDATPLPWTSPLLRWHDGVTSERERLRDDVVCAADAEHVLRDRRRRYTRHADGLELTAVWRGSVCGSVLDPAVWSKWKCASECAAGDVEHSLSSASSVRPPTVRARTAACGALWRRAYPRDLDPASSASRDVGRLWRRLLWLDGCGDDVTVDDDVTSAVCCCCCSLRCQATRLLRRCASISRLRWDAAKRCHWMNSGSTTWLINPVQIQSQIRSSRLHLIYIWLTSMYPAKKPLGLTTNSDSHSRS